MVTAIVGNNDGSDGSHACMRMCKDLEGLLESKKHLRVETPCNDAERLILYRHDNSVEEGGLLARDGAESLYGPEGKFERDVLRRVRKIQSSDRDVVQERRMQDAQFGKKPQKLVVPAHADLANMFDPSTWAMAFPDLFPYGDGVPFLIREAPIEFLETVQYLLRREELVYSVPGDAAVYVGLDRPRWAAHVTRHESVIYLETSCPAPFVCIRVSCLGEWPDDLFR